MAPNLRAAAAFLTAVVLSASLGSLLQSQFNLARIAQLGAPVSLQDRVAVSAADLLNFMPLWAGITAVGFLIAFPMVAILLRWLPRGRTPLYTLAGGAAILVALLIMSRLLPITAVAAARTGSGILALSLAGAFGGWLFARLKPSRR